jgi:electron transport complex protein RnfD
MTREFPISSAPHIRPVTSVPAVMRTVLVALLPAIAAYVWSFGPGLVLNLAVAAVSAYAAESLVLRIRGRDAWRAVSDGSALVTAALIAFALPPLLPWWVPAIAAVAAIVLGKQLFGGLGYNLFNPAMVGYVIVLLSFPSEMIQWLAPRGVAGDWTHLTLLEHLSYAATGGLPAALTVDGVTQATPLDLVRLGLANMQTVPEIRIGPLFGDYGGTGWQLTTTAVALGGALLLVRRVISWHIPLAVCAGVVLPAILFHLIDTSRFPGPGHHVFNGATLLCAFFIATDPVTAAASNRGRLYYGAGIGALTYAIRTWGGYADGVAFAVLLMNAAVPLIDRVTRPRIYGRA